MITALDKNTALVLIDLQKGIAAFPVVHPMEGIIANAAKLTLTHQSQNGPPRVKNHRTPPPGNLRQTFLR